MSTINWNDVVGKTGSSQYEDRIADLRNRAVDVTAIEETVQKTIENLKQNDARSFVIFGEPQSGKTEMMIALNAKLLDERYPLVINLLTDSIDLLDQSLRRFRASGLNPSPKQFSDLPSQPQRLKGREWVVFCKKNARDLAKLNEILRRERDLIVIDDEADYASPDGNINKPDYEKTKINKLISTLLERDGKYIGVTATPARLNLNNTFENESERWVNFAPHPEYVGQEFFFPDDLDVHYRLHCFRADQGDDKNEIQTAILHFLCGVAELHRLGKTRNFTMLVHTSGKREEHADDVELIESTLAILSTASAPRFESLRRKLYKIAETYAASSSATADEIGEFVLRNINRNVVVEINSSKPKAGKVAEIAVPTSLFSFGVGGNIISRGVTFDDLLSLYFSRTVKGKFTQDTYIQRARMFGNRQDYKEHFQLWVPDTLMANWHKCFAFHKLALEALRSGAGVPVWLADHKTTPTAVASIDKSSVDFEGGEMSFGIFGCRPEEIAERFDRRGRSDVEVLEALRDRFGEQEFPSYVFNYLRREVELRKRRISFHKPSGFGTAGSKYTQEEKANIRRTKGIFATNEYRRSELPDALHHLKVFHNASGRARLFYKLNGGAIKFLQSRRG